METILHVLKVVLICVEVLVLFNLLIVVHEMGHFLAARWRGLVIDKFGIWFGKPLWKKTIGGVQYSLGSIPAGGYVMLPQMAPMETIEGKLDGARPNLPPITALDKIIVAVAGPLFSLGLAFVFAVIVWMVGKPVSEREANLKIGYVLPDSPAEKADLRPGDVIEEVDGHHPVRFGGMSDSVVWYVTRSEGSTIPFVVKRGDKDVDLTAVAARPELTSWWRRRETRQVGIVPASTPMIGDVKPGSLADKSGLRQNDLVLDVNGQPLLAPEQFGDIESKNYNRPISLTVERDGKTLPQPITLPAVPLRVHIVKDSPAAKAGLQTDDIITAVNGAPITAFSQLRDATRNGGGQPVAITYTHGGGAPVTVPVTPVKPEDSDKFYVGLEVSSNDDGFSDYGFSWNGYGKFKLVYENPVDQVASSVTDIIETISALLSPKSEIKLQQLGGPVMIFGTYYSLLGLPQGWRLALWFSVLLNVNLALLNMLPFPVLDGGHIMLAVVEAVRRKPINFKLLEIVQSACALLLVGYMLYITFFDVGAFFGDGHSRDLKFTHNGGAAAATAAPKP